jgi:hypothetical protein
MRPTKKEDKFPYYTVNKMCGILLHPFFILVQIGLLINKDLSHVY